ncbi:MAG: DUF4230 domain-containing protein [Allomuricauda sp.]|jgi:hypothetical protein|uniref:DUF4230 domain-containing protein n=1 Tax=Flavobacteriaceae TaxID=49546 RepID=UPI0015C8F564|nr:MULTISPECIES: DUF4230 domain-containing protein [unclassified Allomuricauda]MBO6532856.1 DUF4230 domain-containing protein [Allomuricauda sp.]MBO6590571.1 DUF4230 domain-containing protein [Allomuricauda sp.]MBO6620197.1 DUF4230 domain-containing protein [Allomuricauda sp.]MBO6646112.1 DUF4230 domain-containing protein [Allomuricauda sp.]MBO6748535.1 DUF4230 domain-containing protein [Allomuricauda sp.]
MGEIVDIILGLILGAILMYWVYSLFRKKKSKEITQQQSTVILNKIRSVCKLVSVEGDFAEIYHYENTKDRFMSLFRSKKKALIVIKAKAHIGYDLNKLNMRADNDRKRIILSHFPEPEVLSIEPDLQFYDIKNGIFNSFSPTDLTNLNQEAKEHIKQKIPESGLMETAKNEAMQAVLVVEKIVETIGWTLDYSALELPVTEQQSLEP